MKRITATGAGAAAAAILALGAALGGCAKSAVVARRDARAEARFQTAPDPALEAAILRASPFYTRAVVDAAGGVGRGRYVYGRVDLDADGRDEVFVYLLGSMFCGTGGCNLLLFVDGPSGLSLVDEFPISRLPIIVSAERSAGWSDLWRLESGGGAPASYVRHRFDGRTTSSTSG